MENPQPLNPTPVVPVNIQVVRKGALLGTQEQFNHIMSTIFLNETAKDDSDTLVRIKVQVFSIDSWMNKTRTFYSRIHPAEGKVSALEFSLNGGKFMYRILIEPKLEQ